MKFGHDTLMGAALVLISRQRHARDLKARHRPGPGRARGRNCCEAAGETMTTSPGTQVRPLAETAEHGARLLPPARYRIGVL